MTPHYRHTQVGWVIIGSIAAALLLVLPLVVVDGAPAGAFFVAVPLALAGLLFSTLTVDVDEREIRIRFTGGLVRRRIALAELRGQRVVRNPWLYGWGIHRVPGGWIWNASGFDAVELVLVGGRILRVGTDEPETLSRAIAAVAPAAGTSGDGHPPPRAGAAGRDLARTIGFAAAGRPRGWSRLETLGGGELFVDTEASPFLLVRLRRGFVAVNLSDPERTRALLAEVERRRRP